MGIADNYILVKRKVYPVSFEDFAVWFKDANRQLRLSHLPGGVKVSTVFLGFDHQFTQDLPPILFETMVFQGRFNNYLVRYETYKAAVVGHYRTEKMVCFVARLRRVKNNCPVVANAGRGSG